jgi:hypothetical protein
MADPKQGRVREEDNPFARRTSVEFFREVGAPLVQKKTLSKSAVTIEWIERRGAGAVDWRYRQDRDALFYFEQGVVACRGVLDGSRISRPWSGTSKLAFIARPAALRDGSQRSGAPAAAGVRALRGASCMREMDLLIMLIISGDGTQRRSNMRL